MLSLSPRILAVITAGLLLWIFWGIFAIDILVPAVLRHLTIYPWLAAWILVLLPGLLGAAAVLIRSPED